MRDVIIAKGDGIGPEIMEAVISILKAANAKLNFHEIEIGEKLYRQGLSSGISDEAWQLIKKHKIVLKAPITTPQGKGYKSLNVTFRKTLGLFANVRPVVSFQPFINGPAEKMDMVIVRENEEDLYAGIEYRSTDTNYLAMKLISRAGCEKIIRYAFEYARSNNRKKVTCVIKDNIMKITDGLFHNTFKEIAKEYNEIVADSYIVDIGAARIAAKPQLFDVIVTLNLYGDIISDIAAEISGSVGLAGSANIGMNYAMFEAIHGSAPDIADKNIANPSGLLNAAIMMLNHIGQSDVAANIQNAWLFTIEEGLHTVDIYGPNSKVKLSTSDFAKAIINNLGKKPTTFKTAVSKSAHPIVINLSSAAISTKTLLGVDCYLMDTNHTPIELAKLMMTFVSPLKLQNISQMGLLVWPQSEVEEIGVGMMRLRFMVDQNNKIDGQDILKLMTFIESHNLDIAITHKLYQYDGIDGFSKAQGE